MVLVFPGQVAPAITPCLLSIFSGVFTWASSKASRAVQSNAFSFRSVALSNMLHKTFFSVHYIDSVGFTCEIFVLF